MIVHSEIVEVSETESVVFTCETDQYNEQSKTLHLYYTLIKSSAKNYKVIGDIVTNGINSFILEHHYEKPKESFMIKMCEETGGNRTLHTRDGQRVWIDYGRTLYRTPGGIYYVPNGYNSKLIIEGLNYSNNVTKPNPFGVAYVDVGRYELQSRCVDTYTIISVNFEQQMSFQWRSDLIAHISMANYEYTAHFRDGTSARAFVYIRDRHYRMYASRELNLRIDTDFYSQESSGLGLYMYVHSMGLNGNLASNNIENIFVFNFVLPESDTSTTTELATTDTTEPATTDTTDLATSAAATEPATSASNTQAMLSAALANVSASPMEPNAKATLSAALTNLSVSMSKLSVAMSKLSVVMPPTVVMPPSVSKTPPIVQTAFAIHDGTLYKLQHKGGIVVATGESEGNTRFFCAGADIHAGEITATEVCKYSGSLIEVYSNSMFVDNGMIYQVPKLGGVILDLFGVPHVVDKFSRTTSKLVSTGDVAPPGIRGTFINTFNWVTFTRNNEGGIIRISTSSLPEYIFQTTYTGFMFTNNYMFHLTKDGGKTWVGCVIEICLRQVFISGPAKEDITSIVDFHW